MTDRYSFVLKSAAVAAAQRGIESGKPDAILNDPLALLLGGQEYAQLLINAEKEMQDSQGMRKVHRTPTRSRYIDDKLLEALEPLCSPLFLAESATPIQAQVVLLGAGLDSRPWRLPLPPGVAWFEVDHADCVDGKLARLTKAGAAVEATRTTSAFPLKCASWTGVAADLTQQGWTDALCSGGFQMSVPTVFVAEGLLYYMPAEAADEMLTAASAISPHGSTLLAVTMDDVCMAEIKSRVVKHDQKTSNGMLSSGIVSAYGEKATFPFDCSYKLACLGWRLVSADDSEGWAAKYGRVDDAVTRKEGLLEFANKHYFLIVAKKA